MHQTSVQGQYEYLAHPADLKIKAQGKTLELALSHMITALTASFAPIKQIQANATKKISVTFESRRLTSIVFDVCQRYLELIDTNQLIATQLSDVKIVEKRGTYAIACTFVGDEPHKYDCNNPIKAPTYHEMAIESKDDLVFLTMVVDI